MSNSSNKVTDAEVRGPIPCETDSSSGNCDSSDERSQTSTGSDSSYSGYGAGNTSEHKSGKRRKPLVRSRKEFRLQRRDSRSISENEGVSRGTRTGSLYSKTSRTSSKYNLRLKKKKKSSKSKEKGKEFTETEEEIIQDEALPGNDNDTVQLDENGDFCGYTGKIVEYSPGNHYGRFNILLGEGAYKKVYLAYDAKNGFEVAWNIIKMKNMTTAQQMRIVHEMKILHTLRHDSILKFYNSWFTKKTNTLAFITEAMHSGTLAEFIKARPVRLRIIKRWCRHILNALVYLHEEHTPAIIHRDLKLANIFVNGSSGEIRIGDLGLASWERTGDAKSVLGTPEYMAPEMYQENSYDEKVDIYAFGLCVLEMIGKQIPYKECTTAPQIYRKVMAGEPPDIFNKLKECQLKEFIRICILPSENSKTEENPSGRPTASNLLKHPFLEKNEEDDEDDDKVSEDFFDELPEHEAESNSRSTTSKLSKASKTSRLVRANTSSTKATAPKPKIVRADSDLTTGKLSSQGTLTIGSREPGRSTESLHSLASKASEYKRVLSRLGSQDENGKAFKMETTPSLPPTIEEEKINVEKVYNKAVGKVETKEEQDINADSSINAEEEYNKAEGILKEVEQEETDKAQKQVEFGKKEVVVIDTAAPPVDVSTDTDKTTKVSQETVSPEKEDVHDTYFRWMIEATSKQTEYLVSEDGKLVFDPVIKIACQTDEAAGDFDFDTSSAKDSGVTHLISQALKLEESEYPQLLENIKSIRRQYETFKKRLQKNHDLGKAIENKSFRYGTFNSNQKPQQVQQDAPEQPTLKPMKVATPVVLPDQSQQPVAPAPSSPKLTTTEIPVSEAFKPIKPIKVVESQNQISAIEPSTPRTAEKEDLSTFVDLLIGKDEKAKQENLPEPERAKSPLNIPEMDKPSLFPFINESNEKLDKVEAIEALNLLQQRLQVYIPAFTRENKPCSNAVLNATKAYLNFLDQHSVSIPKSQSAVILPQRSGSTSPSEIRIEVNENILKTVNSATSLAIDPLNAGKQDDITMVENLVMQLSTPTPNPNELKTLDPPAKVLRKHSTADLSQNSDNSTSVHTAVNSTNSLLENDPFKQLESYTVDNTITPEKETNFDSLFPTEDK